MKTFGKGLAIGLAIGLVVLLATSLVAQNVACYMDQGGAGWHLGNGCTMTVESSGILNVASGGAFKIAGTTVSGTAAELNTLAGVTAGTVTASKAVVVDANKRLDTLVIADSGLKLGAGAGTAVTPTAAQINLLVQGVAAGYKIARGTITLDGSNPSSAAHGLATVVACAISNVRSTAPGLDPTQWTYAIAGANIDVYAWKPTAAGDGTLIASTDADDVIAWVCVGT